MFKKILKWTIYAGVVGLLIFGAVIRTEAKSGHNTARSEYRAGNTSTASPGQGGWNAAWPQGGGEETALVGRGLAENRSYTDVGEELHVAAEEEHDWSSLTGFVTGLDAVSLWIQTDQGEDLEITGRAWRFIVESGLALEVGDLVELEGFSEDGEFELSYLMNLTSGDSLQIREESGRPLWRGRAGR